MKKILFASTALAGLALGGAASAEIALFGDARLGIGYNILNDGSTNLEATQSETQTVVTGSQLVLDPDTGEPVNLVLEESETVDTLFEGTEDLRAVSRVRFGVTMTGESDSGITFGATIRADNSQNGQGGSAGQRAGDVFVSGAWGTLTFGDTNGADEQHVGDAGGNLSLTGLGDFNETPFISNGGGFGDDAIQFANNPEARPTVRYDYNFGGFGVSVSTNRDLNDVGVGASYTFEFAEGSVTGGVGYYDFTEFTSDAGVEVRGGEQWSVGGTGTFGGFSGGVVYTAASADYNSGADRIGGDLDVLNVGLGYTFDAWSVAGWYAAILTANGPLDVFDDKDSYGATVAYDLGGGASVNFGVAQTYGRDSRGTPFLENEDGTFSTNGNYISEVDATTVADFGIKMAF
jgi:outer membrane protein OmpU